MLNLLLKGLKTRQVKWMIFFVEDVKGLFS